MFSLVAPVLFGPPPLSLSPLSLSTHLPSLFTPLLLTKMMVMMVMKQDAILSLDVFFLGRRLAPGLFVTNKTKLTFQKHLSHY